MIFAVRLIRVPMICLAEQTREGFCCTTPVQIYLNRALICINIGSPVEGIIFEYDDHFLSL